MEKTITLAQLKELGACEDHLLKFEELFGDEVAVTEELCLKHSSEFDFGWAAGRLFSANAWDEYVRVSDTSLAEYKRVRDTARAEHLLSAPTREEYERARASAWAEYVRMSAITFCRLFNEGRL